MTLHIPSLDIPLEWVSHHYSGHAVTDRKQVEQEILTALNVFLTKCEDYYSKILKNV